MFCPLVVMAKGDLRSPAFILSLLIFCVISGTAYAQTAHPQPHKRLALEFSNDCMIGLYEGLFPDDESYVGGSGAQSMPLELYRGHDGRPTYRTNLQTFDDDEVRVNFGAVLIKESDNFYKVQQLSYSGHSQTNPDEFWMHSGTFGGYLKIDQRVSLTTHSSIHSNYTAGLCAVKLVTVD